ncbi:hypothetical protein HGRIS_013468 [Hohenbuehelia grisea]|uniref:MAT1 centre domain-containing protein n=1 Tax=Hohenbuehelia grisea TaxID=104357 RepID=A0ABR3IVV8_9AGAR
MELNMQREEAYAQALKEQEEGERREREMRAQELRREEEEEREERAREKRQIIDRLETSEKDAHKVVAKSRAEALKRSTARASSAASTASAAATTRALRSRAAQNAIPDPPHVPIQDDYYAYEDAFVLKPGGYQDRMSEAVRRDREGIMRAGGYRVEEAWERAVRSAIAGLDIPVPESDPTKAWAW